MKEDMVIDAKGDGREQQRRKQVDDQFDKLFNEVRIENVQAVCPEWHDHILNGTTEEDVRAYHPTKAGWNEEEMEEARMAAHNEKVEIIWGTLFEAKNEWMADRLRENTAQIDGLGLTLIDIDDWMAERKIDAYETGVFVGVRSAGEDFFARYWVPLWEILGLADWDEVEPNVEDIDRAET